MHVAALIPEDYLPDVQSRLILYKRIAGAKDSRELDDLKGEIIDRFGTLPLSVQNLFQITEIKLQAQHLGILKVDLGDTKGKLEFSKTTSVEPMEIVRLVQQQATPTASTAHPPYALSRIFRSSPTGSRLFKRCLSYCHRKERRLSRSLKQRER